MVTFDIVSDMMLQAIYTFANPGRECDLTCKYFTKIIDSGHTESSSKLLSICFKRVKTIKAGTINVTKLL